MPLHEDAQSAKGNPTSGRPELTDAIRAEVDRVRHALAKGDLTAAASVLDVVTSLADSIDTAPSRSVAPDGMAQDVNDLYRAACELFRLSTPSELPAAHRAFAGARDSYANAMMMILLNDASALQDLE